jgi:hypothetical protein
MAYIEHNFFPLKVFVRNEYMYQFKKGHDKWQTEDSYVMFYDNE